MVRPRAFLFVFISSATAASIPPAPCAHTLTHPPTHTSTHTQYPIVLNGHDGPLTKVMYNREGDIIFSVSKFKESRPVPTAWWSDTGERIGTYDGHKGAVWDCDVTKDSAYLITGSARSNVKIWNVRYGTEIVGFEQPGMGPVRAVRWSHSGKFFFVISWPLKSKNSATLSIYQTPEELLEGDEPYNAKIEDFEVEPDAELEVPRATCGVWMPGDKGILLGGEDGYLRIYAANAEGDIQLMLEKRAHDKKITDIQFDRRMTMFLTASRDCKARLFDTRKIECWKTYKSNFPINSAAIHPLFDHIVFGGGQDDKDVTTTASDEAGFEAQFAHKIIGNIFGKVKSHFGPINSLAVHPDGMSFTSGSEDGTLRIHHFTADYMSKQAREERKMQRWVDKYNELRATGYVEEKSEDDDDDGGCE